MGPWVSSGKGVPNGTPKTAHFSFHWYSVPAMQTQSLLYWKCHLVKNALYIMAVRLHLKVLLDGLLGVQISCTIYIAHLRFFPCPTFPGNLEHLNVELVGV